MPVGFIELNGHVAVTKKGKSLTRYEATIQESSSKTMPNVNVGITPKGTRYYRALLPDKSWGSFFMKKPNGDEVIIDTYKFGADKQVFAEVRDSQKIIQADKKIHQVKLKSKTVNIVTENKKVGQHSMNYVQDDIFIAMSALDKKAQEVISSQKSGILSGIMKIFK